MSEMPPRARRRNLSQAAYENDLAAARRWKREHRDQADKHNWSTCECGNRMARRSKHCGGCRRRAEDERRETIERLWAEGKTAREISAILGVPYRKANLAEWRERGLDLPYRRSLEALVNIRAGNVGKFERARARRA